MALWLLSDSEDAADDAFWNHMGTISATVYRETNSQESAVASLPNEVMDAIFHWTLNLAEREREGEYYNLFAARLILPMTICLSHVCHGWRVYALETPGLWMFVDLAFPRLASLYVERSKTLPFRLYYHLRPDAHATISPYSISLIREVLVQISMPHNQDQDQNKNRAKSCDSERMRSFDLHLPSKRVYDELFFTMISQLKFPRVQILYGTNNRAIDRSQGWGHNRNHDHGYNADLITPVRRVMRIVPPLTPLYARNPFLSARTLP